MDAEGIETEAELAMLRKLGFTMGQGDLLARPMPVQKSSALLKQPGAA